MSDSPPSPIPTLTPSLARNVSDRTQTVLSHIVKTNAISTYFNQSDSLSNFRDTIHHSGSSDVSFQTFHNTVPLSVYEHYAPFIACLFEKPCRLSAIKDLFSPGYPEFIVHSAGTSSGVTKYFPKYRHPQHMSTSTTQTVSASDPKATSGGKNCIVYPLGYRQVIEGVNEDGVVELKIAVCLMSTCTVRLSNDMHIDRDPLYQASKVSSQSSPMGVSFISNYASFLFVHALFSLYEPRVEVINTVFTTVFRDFARVIHDKWDTLVKCIETGSIPDLVGVGDLRDKLLKFLPPNPARAAQLRDIDRTLTSPGWFTKIWPGLRVVVAISSGPFQMVVPEVRHYIGPDVELQTLGINCSEAILALAYDHRDASLYKVVGSDDIIEFLPVDAPEDAKHVQQSWTVQVGGKYEVILTTRDGLWRYRLGDVIEVVGFDPRDGYPVIHYLERRSVFIRLANEIVSGQELLDAISSVSTSFGTVSECCVTPDYHESTSRYAFFVEPHGELGPSPTTVSQDLHTYLARHNENYARESQGGKLACPIVRVLRRGTFGEYREWKVRVSGMASGQVKVPLVVWDEETREWLAARVVEEF